MIAQSPAVDCLGAKWLRSPGTAPRYLVRAWRRKTLGQPATENWGGTSLGIEVDLSLPSARVIRSLEQIIEWRGKPKAIRCDNGPEYLSGALQEWAELQKIKIEYIQPGKPQQNAYVERFNRTVRYDWLSQTMFGSISEVQDAATRWLWTYNNERPNMALGGITPRQKLAMAA